MLPRLIREPILALLDRLGYQLTLRNRNGALHGPILPGATYSPWNADADFQAAMKGIEGHTLVDLYRCYELWSLVGELRHVPGALIEVGVWRGGTGALIGRRARLAGIDAPLYLCDTFSGVVKAGTADPVYVGGEHADTSEGVVRELLARMQVDNTRILRGIFPDETAAGLENTKFRLCHIDVDVYQSAKDVADWIWPRLSVGGAIVYDDYGIAPTAGVTRFVDEQQGLPDRLTVYNLNGHAVTIKTR
ncbi:TylF/MycF/NovP-related O-methyltransferase [Roseateles sp. NT4]|uniref:TylF/MycF/NovP-related O-methyltransferase n=1 Tax=Roseateles sp. NT4 TaxID=3453715 RepID=UPI003EEE09CB